MKNFQTWKFQLRNANYALGGVDVVPLDVLPPIIGDGLIAHLTGFTFDVSGTPTISSGTADVYGQNNIVENIEFTDGLNLRSRCSFNELRFREYLENGKLLMPDPDAAATTESPQFRRYLAVGPTNMAGSPTDFMIPVACLEGGSLTFTFLSALARYAANCSALASVSIRITAHLVGLRNEMRVGPIFEWNRIPAGQADVPVPGHALYTTVAMVDTLATPGTAITAGDFAAVGIDTGKGSIRTQDVQAYSAGFNAEMRSGHISNLMGEPRSATDDNAKMVNSGTPTALVGASAVLQPLIYTPEDCRITKLAYEAGSQIRFMWTGTQTTAGFLYGRVLETPPASEAAMAARGLERLKRKAVARKVKLVEDGGNPGDRENFLPHAYKLG